ncbi:MAG: glycosyltransferase family 9 protein, partial [Bdellovibrionales bacterium]|nr:glycosyltransferase family 9 protein [Bdellovibrionales bacterium]
MEKEISKLLVVLTGSLGDVVRGMCVVDQLKRQFPTLHVSWVIDDKWSGVLSLHDQIDRVIVFERKRGWRGAIKLWRELRDLDFDVTLDLQRHFKSGLISLSSGAKRRIGFHRKNCKEFNYLFNNDQIEFYPDNFPKILHYLKFLEHLGCTIDFELSFGFEKLDPNAALAPELLDFQLPAIGIVLGSSWESKDWLPQGYYDLILKLSREAGHTIVLLGNHSKKDLSDSL